MTTEKEIFRKLLESLNSSDAEKEFKYIGTGNPLSDILIIGKEVAADQDSEQYKKEILSNFRYWYDLEDFDGDKVPHRDFSNYKPLYPYKGQLLKRDNGRNYGTSPTWMKYQKFVNYIFENIDNPGIDFHENAFITEVNSNPSKKTKDADTTSIPFRKKYLLNSKFFRSFSVTIISGVGYFDIGENHNEIEDLFDVKFQRKEFANLEKSTQPYWVHFNEDKSRILINCYQLSIGIADILLKKMAEECRPFLDL